MNNTTPRHAMTSPAWYYQTLVQGYFNPVARSSNPVWFTDQGKSGHDWQVRVMLD